MLICKNLKESVSTWICFLSIMTIIDYILTSYALSIGGFYETNPFTNQTNPLIHCITLLILYWTGYYFLIIKMEAKNKIKMFYTHTYRCLLIILSIISIINNHTSIMLLLGY